MLNVVSDAYSRRAAEYVERFASLAAVHPSDRQLVTTWADGIEGAVLDAGCGPGQWTHFLNEAGVPVLGVDLVPEFIEHARVAYPGIPFRTGSLNALDVGTGTIGGHTNILVDAMTYSAAEDFLHPLVGQPNIRIHGGPTGGGSGRPHTRALLDGIRLSVSTAITYTRDGRAIEFHGIA